MSAARSFRLFAPDEVSMVNYATNGASDRGGSEPRIRPLRDPTPTSVRPPAPPPPSLDGEPGVDRRFGHPIDPTRIANVLGRGLRPLGITLALGVFASLAGLALMPRKYVATAVLKLGEAADGDNGAEARVRAMSDATESVRASDVLARVHIATRQGASGASLAPRIEPAADMQAGVLRIAAEAGTAAESAMLANATARALLAHLESTKRHELEAEVRAIDTRLAAETAELARARTTYDAFRREHGITDLAAERQQQITSAADLRSTGDLATSDIGALQARVAQLRRDLARTPRMVAASAATSSPDQALLLRLEGELTTARSNLSADHPTVRALEMQVSSLRQRIASGHSSAATQVTMGASGQYQMLESALATAEAELAAARERSTSIHELATRARSRVDEFGAIEGEATQLLGAVRTHETMVAENRERRARLESRMRTPDTGFALLTPAARPSAPESAKKRAILYTLLPFGLLLLTSAVLVARDVGRGRLRTPSEIAYWSRVPVIAATDWPRNLRGLDDIVADMDDWSHRADGLTLLVPASEREIALTHTLAERLDEDWMGHGGFDAHFVRAQSTATRAARGRRPAAPAASGGAGTHDAPGATSSAVHHARGGYPPETVIITPPPASSTPAVPRNPTIRGYAVLGPDDPARAGHAGTPGAAHTGASDGGADVQTHGAEDESERPATAIVRLSREPSYALRLHDAPRRSVAAWDGVLAGPKLRRAARLADRVAVVVSSGSIDVSQLASLTTRLGRDHGLGIIVVDLPPRFASLPDRVGPVETFWHAARLET